MDRMSISHLKNQKAKFVTNFVKIESSKNQEKENMKTILKKFEVTSETNDSFIKKGLVSQRDRIH